MVVSKGFRLEFTVEGKLVSLSLSLYIYIIEYTGQPHGTPVVTRVKFPWLGVPADVCAASSPGPGFAHLGVAKPR